MVFWSQRIASLQQGWYRYFSEQCRILLASHHILVWGELEIRGRLENLFWIPYTSSITELAPQPPS